MKKLMLFLFLSITTIVSTAQGGKTSEMKYIDSMVRFVPPTVGPYCPKKLMGGDREFGGHGPEIWAWVKLRIDNKRYLYADIYMHARETVSDWSETEGTWAKLLYTAPAGYEIAELPATKYSEVHYISKPGVSAFSPAGLVQAIGGAKGTDVPFKDDGLVARWNIVGDTGGTDISDDDNCNDDTQVAVQMNPLQIKLKRGVPVSNAPQTQTPALNQKAMIVTNNAVKFNMDSIAQYLPATIGPYCPKKLMGGDREFDGHGPEIWAWTKLRIVSQRYIYADVYMHARETVSDWSETEGTWSKLIYTAPTGYDIIAIQSGSYSEVHYISKPGVSAFSPAGLVQAIGGARGTDVPFKDDGLVARWNIVGDTGGADISDDDNCNDDTQVAVQLNTMKIQLRRKK